MPKKTKNKQNRKHPQGKPSKQNSKSDYRQHHTQQILVITNAKESECATGVTRYAHELEQALKRKNANVVIRRTAAEKEGFLMAAIKRILKKDLAQTATTFPLSLPIKNHNGIIHLTLQTLAMPLMWQKTNKSTQPIIVTVHDIIPIMRRQYHSVIERMFYKCVARGLQRATHIIADSKSTKKDLQQKLGVPEDKITVVYLGINHNKFKVNTKVKRKNKTILYVGSEEKNKNLRTVFFALAQVKKQIPDIVLRKVGRARDENEHKKLLSLAKKLQIEENIEWVGFVEDIVSEYNQATAVIMPSFYEGFGFPVLEAMSCGCPVVCANTSSLPELAGDAALLFDPRNQDEIAKAIETIVTDKKKQKELQNAGKKQAKEFTWKRCTQETMAVYQRIAAQSNK